MEIRQQPRIIVSAIIRQGDKVLLTKEMLESGEKWIIPGGGVEFGENLIDAVKREIKEEIGMDIEVEKLLGHREAIYTQYNYHTVIFFFLAKPLGEFQLSEKQVLDANYFSLTEAENLNLVDTARWVIGQLSVQES